MNPLALAVWIVVLISIPFLLVYRISETQHQKVRRLRNRGWTQKQISVHLGITTYRVRKYLVTA